MQLTRLSRLLIVFGTSIAIFGLMMVTVDPQVQYSVDEVMDDPERFEDSKIFVRGMVSHETMDFDEMKFTLEGANELLIVDFTNSPIPDGFDEGRTIAVRGILNSVSGADGLDIWVIDSFEIQTGCPSKYES
ncbi:MAG: cytochrome c maturation protein CcmE [Candidatus Thalassarchaeaceae archaeon]